MRFKKIVPSSKAPSVSRGYSFIDIDSCEQNVVLKLRMLFLVPLTVATLLITLILIFITYRHEYMDIQRNVLNIQIATKSFYEENVHYDTNALQAIMDGIRQDKTLRTAFLNRDRQALLAHTEPLLKDFKKSFGVTHFYFTEPDRVNLLRVHAPQEYGDTINRLTTRIAENTGKVSSGIEVGPLGTLTLRVVEPWYEENTHQLIGYVELGIEIDRILVQLHNFFDVKAFVLLNKKFLNRSTWEKGMRALGRAPDWDYFPDFVLTSQVEKKYHRRLLN